MDRRRKRVWLAAACAAIALLGLGIVLAILAAGPGASASPGSAVNLVAATDHGCSPDLLTGPDLHVVVRLEGEVVLDATAQDDRDPTFAAFAAVGRTGTIEVVAEELEPLGATLPCDLTPGPGDAATFEWDGSSVERMLRGSGPRSAEVHLVLGPAPAGVTGLRVEAEATRATLSWSLPSPRPDSLQVMRGASGAAALVLAGDATSATFEGLCDGLEYTVRVVAQAGAWWVPAEARFRTTNLPPAPPRILEADAKGSRVAWEMPSPHDIARYELHAGAGAFAPSAATLVATAAAGGTVTESMQAGEPLAGDLRIVAVDGGGLTSVSDPFPVGAPASPPTPELARCGGFDPLDASVDRDTPLPALLPLLGAGLAAMAARRRGRGSA